MSPGFPSDGLADSHRLQEGECLSRFAITDKGRMRSRHRSERCFSWQPPGPRGYGLGSLSLRLLPFPARRPRIPYL